MTVPSPNKHKSRQRLILRKVILNVHYYYSCSKPLKSAKTFGNISWSRYPGVGTLDPVPLGL
jgi:hypothetical protein